METITKEMMREKYYVTYGKDHVEKFNTYEEARERAYEMGFYFTVSINGIQQNRIL